MYAKACAFIVLLYILSAAAFAADDRQPPGLPLLNPFQGTPEEQAACAPDANNFCKDAIPDPLRVLACLKDHRQRIRKVCLKVLEDHGQ
jgi:Cysteine rich repeat